MLPFEDLQLLSFFSFFTTFLFSLALLLSLYFFISKRRSFSYVSQPLKNSQTEEVVIGGQVTSSVSGFYFWTWVAAVFG